jgi:transcription elongation factor GreA
VLGTDAAVVAAASAVPITGKDRGVDSTMVSSDAHAMTQAGYERLRDELQELSTTRRDELADALKDARADGGDLADNAALADAIDEQQRLERRIEELEATLAYARIVPPARDGTAGIGSRVRVCREGRPPIVYELVGALEADPRTHRVSIASPVGRALLGRSAGDIVDVDTPSGRRRLEVLAVDQVALEASAA